VHEEPIARDTLDPKNGPAHAQTRVLSQDVVNVPGW
jgi:hypothetical protein